MRAVDIIERKRDKHELTKEEIKFLLTDYLDGKIPDYQMSSFLMATYFNDMTDQELLEFTMTMRDSGDVISFPSTRSKSASISCPAFTSEGPACAARIFCVIVIPMNLFLHFFFY